MRDYTLSADQVRSASGATFAEAQVAVYMASVSDTKSLRQFAESIGVDMKAARWLAYEWGVRFSDYDPFAQAKRLEWRKAKNGWELLDGDAVIGTCQRTSEGRYLASADPVTVENWEADRAMMLAAAELDALSPGLKGFNGKPVKAVKTNQSGLVDTVLFPPAGSDEKVGQRRDALDFRAQTLAA